MDLNATLESLTFTDGLTGLKNHRAFQEQLGSQIAIINPMPSPLSLLLIDVDHFKGINDTFGHPIGDEYLKETARILRSNSREGDFVARYGGEEFSVIPPNTDDQSALIVAEKFRKAVEFAPRSKRPITISIGGSTFPADTIGDKALLIASADRALYMSKERGRNRVTHAIDLESSGPGR